MSHDATERARAVRGLGWSERLILLNLADRARRVTGRCWPSQQVLAEEEGMSRSTVQRALRSLRKRGLVTVETRGRGPNTSSTYVLSTELIGVIGDASSSANRRQTHTEEASNTHLIGVTCDHLTGKEPVGNRAGRPGNPDGRPAGAGKDAPRGDVPERSDNVRRAERNDAAGCDLCDEHGWRETPNGVLRCDHRATAARP